MIRRAAFAALLALAVAVFGHGLPGPASIEIVSGDGQSGAPGQVLSTPLGVKVTDAGGAAVAGAAVRFSVDPAFGGFVVENPADGTIETIAGGGNFGDGGPAVEAALSATGALAALSGGLQFTCTPDGGLLVSDAGHRLIRKIDADGIITTVAGNGDSGPVEDGVPATETAAGTPVGLACDDAGNFYFGDAANLRVARVDGASGIVTTVAQFASPTFSVQGVAVDVAGNIFVAAVDKVGGSEEGFIRRIAPDGTVTTEVGGLLRPEGIAMAPNGDILIADVNAHQILRMTPGSGFFTVLAGTGSPGFSGDGASAIAAQLTGPSAVVADATGAVYIADTLNARVRRVDAAGTIETVAGSGSFLFEGDFGPALSAGLPKPVGVAVGATGDLFISTSSDGRVRRVDAFGTIFTHAGNGTASHAGDGGPPTSATLNFPRDVGVDSAGRIYLADTSNGRLKRIEGGIIQTVVGGGPDPLADGAPGTGVGQITLSNISVEKDDRVLFTDDGRRIFRWDPATALVGFVHEAVAEGDNTRVLVDVAASPTGDIFYTMLDQNVPGTHLRRIEAGTGAVTTVATFGFINVFLTIDRGGIVLLLKASSSDPGLLAYNPHEDTTTTILNIAGQAITTDRFGHVYIAAGNKVRYIERVTGVLTPVAGAGFAFGFSGDGGPANAAQLSGVAGLALTPDGRLLLADPGNDRLRRVTFGTQVKDEVHVITDLGGFAFSPLFQLGFLDPPSFPVPASVVGTTVATSFALSFSAEPGGPPAVPDPDQTERRANNIEATKFPRWLPMTALVKTYYPPATPPEEPPPGASHKTIALDSHNVVHVVHSIQDPDLPTSANAIWYFTNRWETRKANGFSRGFAVSGSESGERPSIAVDALTDEVHVVWVSPSPKSFPLKSLKSVQ